MKLDTLFDNYDLLMDSPNSTVTMRKLILQLAVQGKLAPQDPNDEPAGELLKRIKAEKEKLIAEGKIKKQKPLPPVAEDEILYELPQGWEWVRLGEITNYGASNKVEPDNVKDDETWVLELEDIEKTTSILLKKVRYKDRPFKSTKNVFLSGDVLYGKLRPYLDKVLVADEDGICTTEILPLRSEIINPYYLRYSLKRKDFLEYVDSVVYGMKKFLFPHLPNNTASSPKWIN
jgi:type I restriction enzyme S subunit